MNSSTRRPTCRKQPVLDGNGDLVGQMEVWTHGVISAHVRHPNGNLCWMPLDTKTVSTAENAVRAERLRLVAEEDGYAKNPKADLARKLARCDWYSDFSDDHGVWQRGNAQKDEIARLVKLIGAEGDAMYKAACPWLNGTDKTIQS